MNTNQISYQSGWYTINLNLCSGPSFITPCETSVEYRRPEMSKDPFTLDELLSCYGLHLITYQPRYTGGYYGASPVGVFIGGPVEELAMMADSMTASGDYCQHIVNMLNETLYLPWGEGKSFTEAVQKALDRVNQFPKDQWLEYALPVVERLASDYPAIREQYRDWEPYPTIEQLVAENS